MEYQGIASHEYYNYPEVLHANTFYDYNNDFASTMNSHIGVASHNTSYVASANTFVNTSHHTHHNTSHVNCEFFEY